MVSSNLPKNQRNFFQDFCPRKRGQIKEISFILTLLHYFFDSTSILLVFGRFEDSKRTFRNKSTFFSNRIYLKSRTLRMNQGCISLKLLSCKKSTKMNVLPTNLMKSWKKCTNRRSKSFKKEKKILKDFKKCVFL